MGLLHAGTAGRRSSHRYCRAQPGRRHRCLLMSQPKAVDYRTQSVGSFSVVPLTCSYLVLSHQTSPSLASSPLMYSLWASTPSTYSMTIRRPLTVQSAVSPARPSPARAVSRTQHPPMNASTFCAPRRHTHTASTLVSQARRAPPVGPPAELGEMLRRGDPCNCSA